MADAIKAWHIKGCPLFQSLSDAETREFEHLSRMVTFPSGKEVPLNRDPNAVWVVKAGHVRRDLMNPEGEESTLLLLGPGDFFGATLEGPADSCERAFAFDEAVLCRVEASDRHAMMQRHRAFSVRVTKLTLFRFRRLQTRLGDLLMKSARERLACVLLDLAREGGGGRLSVTHADLARLVGTSREMVSILLARFRSERLVETRRRSVRLLDGDALRNSSRAERN